MINILHNINSIFITYCIIYVIISSNSLRLADNNWFSQLYRDSEGSTSNWNWVLIVTEVQKLNFISTYNCI